MKRASLVAALTTCLAPLAAHAAVITQWTFESSLPGYSSTTGATGSNPIPPGTIAPEVGTGNAGNSFHAATATVWSSPVGNGSAHAFSSNNWTVDDYYLFQTSTTGYSGITVEWDQTGSNTGPKDFSLEYSLNGTTFTPFASYAVLFASPSWNGTTANPANHYSYDLSSVTALNSASPVYFRLRDTSTVSVNGGTVGTGGTSRVDNFTVSGLPEPGTIGLLIVGSAFLARRKR